MPIPLIPIAGAAISTGAVALAGYRVARNIRLGRRDQTAEDALDNVEEGATLRTDPGQASGTLNWKRVIRFGETGPAFHVDGSLLARIKIKRVD